MIKNRVCTIFLLLLCISLLSACKSKEEKLQETVIINTQNDSQLVMGIESVDTFNPVFTKSQTVQDAMKLIFEPLFSVDEAFNPVCVLAQSGNRNEDKKIFTVTINEGIKWHDGTDFTVEDVIHTVELIKNNDTVYTKELSELVSCSKVNNKTVRFSFTRPVPNVCALLTFPIVKKSVTSEGLEKYIPCGTGAYKYSDKSTSGRIELIKNEAWHGTHPNIPNIYLTLLKDKNAVVDAFNASEVDIITTKTIDLASKTPLGEITQNDYISNDMVFLGINNTHKLLSGKNTRKALGCLIKKDEIVVNEVFSRAEAADVPLNPQGWYYPKNDKPLVDTEYIEELLLLDGYKKENSKFIRTKTDENGDESKEELKLSILVNSDNEERIRIADKIASYLSDFGIGVTVDKKSFEDYSERISNREYSLFVGEIRLACNMDIQPLLCYENNYFGYSSARMNELCYKMGALDNTEEIKNNYQDFYMTFNEEMPFIPLFFRKESVFFKKNISGTGTPTVFSPLMNAQDWYIVKM